MGFADVPLHVGDRPIYLTAQDVQVVHRTPRLLIVKIDCPAWHACLVVGHAPQSGQPEVEPGPMVARADGKTSTAG